MVLAAKDCINMNKISYDTSSKCENKNENKENQEIFRVPSVAVSVYSIEACCGRCRSFIVILLPPMGDMTVHAYLGVKTNPLKK